MNKTALTIVSVPKAFKGKFELIQRNAIQSWKALEGNIRIILLGDDEGTAEVAKEFNLIHVPEILRTDQGTPRVDYIFESARKNTSGRWICYVNADIILLGEILEVINKISFRRAMICGRRTDIDIDYRIDFSSDVWEKTLIEGVKRRGVLHGATGIDYFLHTKNIFKNIPPFALGRTAWDNWILYNCIKNKIPLIDATNMILAIHQNHDYSHAVGGANEVWKGEEAKINLALSRPGENFTLDRCNWEFSKFGMKRKLFFIPKEIKRRIPRIKLLEAPLVSVVMPVYNREKTVGAAVESIRKQSYEKWELIVVNDGSTDETKKIIEEVSKKDSRVKIINLPKQSSLSSVRNTGIKASIGKYIAPMDSDDISHKNRLLRLVSFLEANTSIAAVSSWAENRDLSGTFLSSYTTSTMPEDIRIETPLRDPVVHAASVLRKKVLSRIGFYDEFYEFSHDSKLWVDIVKAEFDVAALPEYLYTIRLHGSNLTYRSELRSIARRAYSEFWRIAIEEYPIRAVRWIDDALAELGDNSIIWGTGQAARLLVDWLREKGKKIKAFIERDDARRRKLNREKILPAPVISLEKLIESKFSKIAIASSVAQAEIEEKLLQMGFNRKEHFMAVTFLLTKRIELLKEINQ